jgi:hypothetical protein
MAQLVVALITFGIGATAGVIWHAQRNHVVNHSSNQVAMRPDSQQQDEPPWPLTQQLVSRALQTRQLSTKRLIRNSDDEVVWRWLRQAITEYQATAGYEQDSLVLPLSDAHYYFVVIYPLSVDELRFFNLDLRKAGRPLLQANHRYARIQVNYDNIACPEWIGIIDLEAPKLMFLRGSGG